MARGRVVAMYWEDNNAGAVLLVRLQRPREEPILPPSPLTSQPGEINSCGQCGLVNPR